MTRAIHILNGSHLSERYLASIARGVEQVFNVHTYVEPASFDLDRAYDDSRCQYSSAVLLSELLAGLLTASNEKWIAIVDVDLYIPVLTFIFGEAQFNGSIAIVSTHRLSNQFYGLPQDATKLVERLEKEIVHELGHMFGLYHCRQFECVMRSSTYVEEIDLKRTGLCSGCGSLIRNTRQTTEPSS